MLGHADEQSRSLRGKYTNWSDAEQHSDSARLMSIGHHNEPPAPSGSLAPGWRWAAAMACLGGLGAGVIAVFKTDNEIGSTALLAVGLYFAIVAALGRFPKIKLGENEIDPNVLAAAAHGGANAAADAAARAAAEDKPSDEVALAARRVEQNIKLAWTPMPFDVPHVPDPSQFEDDQDSK